MKKILFPLFLVLICFMITPILGFSAALVFLVWLSINAMPTIYALCGNKKYSDGQAKDALRLYRKAIATGKASDKVKLSYAVMLLTEGWPEDAEKFFNEVIISKKAEKPLKLKAKQYRAIAYCKLNRMKDAMDDAKEVFEVCKNVTTYGLLGYVMNVVKTQPTELLEFCEKAYEYNPDERDIRDNYILALFKNGEYEKAREIGEKLTEDYPWYIEGCYHTAMCFLALGNKKEAKRLLEKASDCDWTYLSTVTKEEVAQLLEEVQDA